MRRRRDGKVIYYALDDDHVTALLTMGFAHVDEERRPETERESA
jgi:ArsR family transcriptional regulator, lead/cadmium/zinc/bismuth-responsive transcriptional repressor